ncbi:4-(cytidine 5'-diphospho)-2-C-methyl-D-erythritol kinase [Mariniplasma anaerobium]|uniref:4-diphosphocytidyl-2-C-methyl-D-erythritol kinase n=1 Tax=Mariniplasma anaerobium TaxID=2735436 RepID=A0A7U9TH53_9MOLU|nr:4-(cytidine 5'-diphospho)-2-C-methyl-D-erythritol kinase [Mariniplasma anaerobium]BCR35130.1 4-diphosphocytidyl-2-C-methyl-D-erythritol kinase [Mariniplasma anaerobium]
MIYEKAHAKINLALDVIKKRDDGYHELKMIMVPIELHDQLSFELSDDIKLTSNIDIKDNQVLKTAYLIKDKYKVDTGAHIYLKKDIPIGAGLAGGSSDIAATIRGLNKLWNLNLDKKALEDIALSLGSDTLYCLYQKPAYVYGRGEHLEFIDLPKTGTIFLYYPKIISSTACVFKNHNIIDKQNQFENLLEAYQHQAWDLFYKTTYNALHLTALKCYPELQKAYKIMKNIDDNAFMSGSGSTFFIINSSQKDEEIIKKAQENNIKLVKTSLKA